MKYIETWKTLREDIRKINSKMIKTPIKEKGNLKKVKKRNLGQGRRTITIILDSNGQEITDQDEILKSSISNYMTVTHKQKNQKNQMNQYQVSQIGR